MIVQLTGTLLEVLPSHVVIDVGGVGYELGVSATTAASLPAVGEAGVTVLTRMLVKENSVELYGFATREERAVFDRLVAVSGVGPKLALAVLSTFSPATLATIVTLQDEERMAQVPGVGRKKAQRLLVELQDVFAKDATLRGLVGMSEPAPRRSAPSPLPRRLRRRFSRWASRPRRRSLPSTGTRRLAHPLLRRPSSSHSRGLEATCDVGGARGGPLRRRSRLEWRPWWPKTRDGRAHGR